MRTRTILLTAFITLSLVLCLVGCTKEKETDNVYSETAISNAESTTAPIITEDIYSQYTVSIGTNEENYIIYWNENGEEKSQTNTGFKSPYTIINDVLCKYYGDGAKLSGVYDADWYITEYYEESTSCEDGLARTVHCTAVLDLSEGYSAYIGPDDLNKVTTSIAKSFMDSYDLESIRISELKEDILYLER